MNYQADADQAFAQIDAGNTLLAFSTFEKWWKAGERRAILGMAEVKEVTGEEDERLAIVDLGLAGFANDYPLDEVSVALLLYHAIPVLWPRTSNDLFFPDPEEAIRTRIDLLRHLCDALPLGLPETDMEFFGWKTISNLADNILYTIGSIKVAELQISAATKLMATDNPFYRTVAVKNLHNFFRANSPARIGAMAIINSEANSLSGGLAKAIEQFGRLEEATENLASKTISLADALELNNAFDEAIGKPGSMFYVYQAAMMDYLISERADQSNQQIMAFHDKFRGVA